MKLRKIILALAAIPVISLCAVWLEGIELTKAAPQKVGELPPDLKGSSVQFQSGSGAMIRGWFLPGQRGSGAVALMHGVRSNRCSMLDRARFLSHVGYAVLLFDFQAHGESEGSHITFGSLESKDAQAAIQFLRSNAPGEKIGVVGVSMGGAAAVLATPRLDVDALVIEMVYPTIDEAVNNRLTMRLGHWSRVFTPLLELELRTRLGISANDLRPIDHVGGLTTPKLFIVGSKDIHTTLEESQRLYDTASDPKEFWIIQGAAHVDLHNAAKTEYEHRLLEFFSKHLR